MRVLVLHLSDIHIRDSGDPVLSRAEAIARAAAAFGDGAALCVIALTGDVAFSGRLAEYELAKKWVDDVRTVLARELRDMLHTAVVAVPGNHDCDLSTVPAARSALIEAMAHSPGLATDPATVSTCLGPQKAFFTFRDQVASDGVVGQSMLYYEYRFAVESENVLIRCCNTAWVSQKPENPAHLFYPESIVPSVPVGGGQHEDLVLTLMHHTYNWLVPGNIRALRRRLQSVSDFILTGHEHEFGLAQVRDEHGGEAFYIEGLALQAHTKAHAEGFNVVGVDTETMQFRVIPFTWIGDRYTPQLNGAYSSWAPFDVNPRRAGHAFPLKPEMESRLGDLGITLLTPDKSHYSLEDLFVYPDLREVASDPTIRAQSRTLSARELLSESGQRGRLCVTGGEEAGKSTLARRLFLDALNLGLVPLLLDGASARLRGDDRDLKELVRIFEEQYEAEGTQYLDLPRERRLILLDGVAELRNSKVSPRVIADYLSHHAGQVIVFSDDVAQWVQEITGVGALASGQTPFHRYALLPFGHVKREEIIDRYVAIACAGDPVLAESLRADMRSILTAAVGKYGAPATPVTILALLQGRAFHEQLNLQHSTYGYYYDLLIKRQLLGAQATIPEIEIRLAYLTELAHAVFLSGEIQWSEAWMMEFHQGFVATRRLQLGFRNTIDFFVAHGLLRSHLDTCEFRHQYIYYYFVGRALAERLPTPEGREKVAELTNRLHEQDIANILLFLTHHSKDAAIIDPMVARAETLFADSHAAMLESGDSTLPGLNDALREATYTDRPIAEQRRVYLARIDEAEADARAPHETTGDGSSTEQERRDARESTVQSVVDLIARLNVSFRTMQILGQVLKNFPTLTGDQKERITRATYGVALRTLGFVHELVRDNTDVFVAQIVNAIKQEHPDLSIQQVSAAARNVVAWYMYVASYGMVQRTSADVASPLLDPVLMGIVASDPFPAIQLITVAVKLQRSGGFPEEDVLGLYRRLAGNPMALRILRGLVVGHFHMFDVPPAQKQRLCALLAIKYRPLPPLARTRLIAAPPGT